MRKNYLFSIENKVKKINKVINVHLFFLNLHMKKKNMFMEGSVWRSHAMEAPMQGNK